MKDSYLTVASPAEGVYKEKGSKFLATIFEIKSEEEALIHVADFKKRFHDARHHCYAYQLGVDGEKYRENDDGEPSGTAGKPIRGQIRSKGITNVLIIVVRYFGGTKLGVSGLINAYKLSALDAIENAIIIEKVVEAQIVFEFDYLLMNDVMRLIKESRCRIVSQEYGNRSKFVLAIRESELISLSNQLANIEGVKIVDVGVK